MTVSPELRPYQEVGRDFLVARRQALLADEMRVGKTPQAILAAQKACAKDVLVLAPAIALEQWRREWQRWAGVCASVLGRGDGPRPGVNICSYDRGVRLKDELVARRWDVTIADEAHFAKNPTALRTKLLYGKQGLAHTSEYTWPLSGTPAPRDASDLWTMLYTFGATKLRHFDFVRRYCIVDYAGRILGTNTKRIPELKEMLAPYVLRRTRAEVAPDMPEIDFNFLNIQVNNPSDYNVPSNLSGDDLLLWLEAHRTDQTQSRAEVALAKALPVAAEVQLALESELLTQTVVFGYHVAALEAVARLLITAGFRVGLITGQVSAAERTRIQDAFAAGEIQVVVGQIIAAGTAIDLSAARHGYFLELDWIPGNNAQAANRLVNVMKKDKVTFDVATWSGSVDDRVQRVLARRVQEQIL